LTHEAERVDEVGRADGLARAACSSAGSAWDALQDRRVCVGGARGTGSVGCVPGSRWMESSATSDPSGYLPRRRSSLEPLGRRPEPRGERSKKRVRANPDPDQRRAKRGETEFPFGAWGCPTGKKKPVTLEGDGLGRLGWSTPVRSAARRRVPGCAWVHR